jgi:hypothetical protein
LITAAVRGGALKPIQQTMKPSLKLVGTVASAVLALPAIAEIELTENLSVSGYVVGAYTRTDYSRGPSEDTFFDSGINTFDSAKVLLKAHSGPLAAVGSLLFIPEFTGASREVGILDAYVSYTAGDVTVTAGKFLSYLGFEAFDPVNMTQLTYGLISGIPAYHSGVKLDYAQETFSTGVAFVDSVNPGPGFYRGDGEFSDDVGMEAFFSYTGIEKLTIFTGIGYENTDGLGDKVIVWDLWASYAVTDQLTIAGEIAYNNNVAKSWLAFAQYSFTPSFSIIGRVSGIDYDAGGNAHKVTVAPTYVINEHFSVRAEYSKTWDVGPNSDFFGVQGVFRF